VRIPSMSFTANGESSIPQIPPPELGSDADAVMQALGLDEDQLKSLRAAGII